MGFDLDANEQSLPVPPDMMVRLGDIGRRPSATRGNDDLVIHDRWQDPDDFGPHRFSPAVASSRHRFAVLPFSAGARVCVGAGFAIAEIAAHLRILACRFLVHCSGPAPAATECRIHLRSRHPLHMRLIPI